MSKGKICFIGKPINKLLEEYRSLGFEIAVAIDVNDLVTKFPEWLSEIYKIDMSSEASITEALPLLKDASITIVLSTNESYVLPKSWITTALQLPGTSPESASASSDKYIMRSKFAQYEEANKVKISTQFAQVESRTDLENFAKKHQFPLILKPANLFKSILVTKAHNLEELLMQYEYALPKVAQLYKDNNVRQRQPRFVVEEFLVGKMHSVEAFIDSAGKAYFAPSVVDLTIAKEIGVDDNFHFSRMIPSKLDDAKSSTFFEIAQEGVLALGLSNTATHIELVDTQDGPRIIEIGARIGGYRCEMFQHAYNSDLKLAEIAVVTNQVPQFDTKVKANVAVIELFPEQEGKFKKIANQEQLEKLPSCMSYSIKRKPGDNIGLSNQGYKATAVIFLKNKSNEQFQSDYNFVKTQVKVLCS